MNMTMDSSKESGSRNLKGKDVQFPLPNLLPKLQTVNITQRDLNCNPLTVVYLSLGQVISFHGQ